MKYSRSEFYECEYDTERGQDVEKDGAGWGG